MDADATNYAFKKKTVEIDCRLPCQNDPLRICVIYCIMSGTRSGGELSLLKGRSQPGRAEAEESGAESFCT